tara:strand:- start:1876 stop:3456 length:1581 start_codon:yes stop_codon:yes gene_type:complete
MSKKINDLEWDINPISKGYDSNNKNTNAMKSLLDSKGKGFCLAKWTQVTMHLGNGTTHSCHHPTAHKIPLEELKINPSALHNTNYKKKVRKEMIDGKRPSECDFCWRVEDNGQTSDRILKSLDSYSFKHHDKIAELLGNEDIFPTYVEVSFGNTCNFKCAYCGPAYSSQWTQEIKKDGPYVLEDMKFNVTEQDETHIPHRERNPYIEAFWEWFPEAYKHMHTFRITGGEPLLIKDTMKVIDFLLENPNPELSFAINSNGCPPDGMWEEFTTKIRLLEEGNCIKDFVLFTSAEASGNKNDYVRYGMDYDLWKKNIEYFLRNTLGAGVTCMSAFNVLSITTFKELLEWILVLKQDFNYTGWDKWLIEKGYERIPTNANALPMDKRMNEKFNKRNRVLIDIPYLRHPSFLDASIASPELIEKYLIPAIDFMYTHVTHGDWFGNLGFDDWEAGKMRRNVIDIINKSVQHVEDSHLSTNDNIRKDRGRFYNFVIEYDRRRSTNFLDTFPEYTEFYALCKREHEVYIEIKSR